MSYDFWWLVMAGQPEIWVLGKLGVFGPVAQRAAEDLEPAMALVSFAIIVVGVIGYAAWRLTRHLRTKSS